MTLNQYQLQGSFSAEPEVAAKIEGAIRSALAEGGVQNPEIDFGRDWLSVDHITTEARLAGNQVLTEGPSEFDGLE